MLLGNSRHGRSGGIRQPCLILNKRSMKVRQPGDLCCPGGSVSPGIDYKLAQLLFLPGTPIRRWRFLGQWRRKRPAEADYLGLLLATGLRESFEEMRLNPFGVRFLGPLPPAELVMFRRKIYPLVCWVARQKKFTANWEVDKIVSIPLFVNYLLLYERFYKLLNEKRDSFCLL